ncbi:MAG: hypothetical protein DRI95_08645 [Bacteroidetes bacterium]|nr:MAG: hypothetical protein DRI95_08645 [Bacteroidota bacterium]RLD76194.1 MAG: hypothetical protein DRJ07_16745 [Bacteroidota bacterium]
MSAITRTAPMLLNIINFFILYILNYFYLIYGAPKMLNPHIKILALFSHAYEENTIHGCFIYLSLNYQLS